MQLRDRRRLSLDDPITRHVPELRQLHDPFGSPDDVSIRMLLSHSAGFQIPTWPYGAGRPWESFEPTRREQLVGIMPYQELAFAPGPRFGYSNPAFIYLARVVEALTGDPWAVYTQKNLWTPLGMTRSFVGVSPYHPADRRAASYTLCADGAAVAGRYDGGTTDVGYTGEQSGFRSFFYLDPASTTAVIGVLNTTTEARPESSRRGWDMVTRRAVELVGP